MRRLLIVEDDPRLRQIVVDALDEEKWNVTQAASGDEAGALLDAGTVFDVLITDVRMPGALDGIGLARKARAFGTDMKIVVVSGFLDAEINPIVTERLGTFLQKPFTITQLEGAVNG